VLDEAGKRMKNLPDAGKKDDAELAAAAAVRWKALKADVRTLASQQVLRLELAMCEERRFTPELFVQLLVKHPLMIHLVRRVIWGAFAKDSLVATFRVAEDRSFAGIGDDPFELPPDSEIGLVHPLELDETLARRWGDMLSDYDLAQPFVQLGREVYRATPKEKTATRLDRVDNVKVPTGNVLKLDSRGWRRGVPQDAGCIWWFDKPIGDGVVARLSFEPGIVAGDAMWEAEQTLHTVVLTDADSYGDGDARPLSELGEVAFSELVRDLELLRA
jgi:hypothetical protein